MRKSILRSTATTALALLLCAFPASMRSQVIPASATTGQDSSTALQTQTARVSSPVQSSVSVLWDGVSLQVIASNAPLSRVLREISSRTKLRISGNAPEEQIFGTYGPGPINLVIPALLDGLPVNTLLVEGSGDTVSSLSITPRLGTPTSASVPTQASVEESTQPTTINSGVTRPANGFVPPQRGLPPNNQGFAPIAGPTLGDNGISGSDNGISGPNNGVNGADNGIGVAPSGTDVNATGTASPNGVRTPQEIFEQLQRLRQQQSQPQQ